MIIYHKYRVLFKIVHNVNYTFSVLAVNFETQSIAFITVSINIDFRAFIKAFIKAFIPLTITIRFQIMTSKARK